jgi:putative membrane protein insertion efficiency factor
VKVNGLSRALALLLMLPIRFYKAVLSPLLPPMCRFHPSCSVYALGALAVHGPFKGSWLALRRIGRCHPLNPGGLDPVPPRDGRPASALLEELEPALATRLAEPPPPHLAAVLPPQPRH